MRFNYKYKHGNDEDVCVWVMEISPLGCEIFALKEI